ncbi:uncharacterized protein [Procambarus clarkii]|uniref:uncharacterized protein isoform X1 n=1 Tax=Procambarus clarkii TaxID=6728 RepID=UPI001E675ED6|nr:amino acid transporter AVT1C-like isoform X1 [Procambarus clarkii]XP_045603650.1 amino acid transporter AVT1C-like isoform X1 [Procambarus clarkii]XP_045603651.1 amino acid transporter AVT1C-like isoform X1 [Procambarus clarkii]XP_045603652.1 amino acid transporter AVT1C-like isoform X1 [Procambarus clarkii]XP_045603653.1 amino acid transporter AVT1C-like isoform X1 [Procambarus clarkii]XP_045603654.1 amino acid transporter AVT1C-like isoform X1 [Procambarus clarkii]
MSVEGETTALLGYGRGGPPRLTEIPRTPPRSVFEAPDTSLLQSKQGPGPPPPPPGIGMATAVCYILGVFGVVPVVSLPGAIAYCGWFGFVVFGVLVLVQVYTAVLLGKCWLFLEMFWPREAILQRRYPYPALAEKAGGTTLRRVVSVMQDVAIFGAAVPFMLLASDTLQELVERLSGVDFSFCYWLLITTLVLTPLLWLGTPKDLGVVTWIGAGCMVIVSVLTLAGLVLNAPQQFDPPPTVPSFATVAYCFGAVAFQFDIHPMILTVQMDMQHKDRLPLALIIAFIIGVCLFGGISLVAFFFFGSSVKTNILNNLSPGVLLYINMVIVSVQILMCLVLGINTLFQDLENSLRIPDEFGWRRICLRTTVMLLVLFLCESVPHFGVAIELVGGLLVTPFIFFFPATFHIIIKKKATGQLDVKDIVLAANIMFLGVVGCIAATTDSFINVAILKDFAPPCYINITAASTLTEGSGLPGPKVP